MTQQIMVFFQQLQFHHAEKKNDLTNSLTQTCETNFINDLIFTFKTNTKCPGKLYYQTRQSDDPTVPVAATV